MKLNSVRLLFVILLLTPMSIGYAGSSDDCLPRWVDISHCTSSGDKVFLRYTERPGYSHAQEVYVACGNRYGNSDPLIINGEKVWFKVEGVDIRGANVAFILDIPSRAKTLADVKIKALVRKAGTRIVVPCRWKHSKQEDSKGECVLMCGSEKKPNDER